MTTKIEEAARQALGALEQAGYGGSYAAIDLREALAEQEKQEPVAVISESAIGLVKLHANGVSLPFGTPLYAAPVSAPAQEPVAMRFTKPGVNDFDILFDRKAMPQMIEILKEFSEIDGSDE